MLNDCRAICRNRPIELAFGNGKALTRSCSVKKAVLKNFLKFTEKHLRQSLFFNKIEVCNFIKTENLAQVFSCEFSEIFKNTFIQRTRLVTASWNAWLNKTNSKMFKIPITYSVEECQRSTWSPARHLW